MAEEPKLAPPEGAQEHKPQMDAGLDTAGQSLRTALRWSFRVLACVIVLVIAYFLLVEGFFTVKPGEKAIILRFGQADASRVKSEGLHYHLPYPIDECITVETVRRDLEINTFWPRLSEYTRVAILEGKQESLKTEHGKTVTQYATGSSDGFVLTRDMNILECRWQIRYQLPDKDREAIIKYYKVFGNDHDREEQLVRNLVENAIVKEVACMNVFDAYLHKTTELKAAVERRIRNDLLIMDCGLVLEAGALILVDIKPPAKVIYAFDLPSQAKTRSDDLVRKAVTTRTNILLEAGGALGNDLGDAMTAWWKAYEQEEPDEDKMAKLQKSIENMMEDEKKRGGNIASIIITATSKRKGIVSDAEREANTFTEIRKYPEDVPMWVKMASLTALHEVLGNAQEVMIIQPAGKEKVLTINLTSSAEVRREQSKVKEQK